MVFGLSKWERQQAALDRENSSIADAVRRQSRREEEVKLARKQGVQQARERAGKPTGVMGFLNTLAGPTPAPKRVRYRVSSRPKKRKAKRATYRYRTVKAKSSPAFEPVNLLDLKF